MRRKELHEEAVQPRRSAARDKAAAARDLKLVYRLLLTAFGPQGWWPVTPCGEDLPVYTPGRYSAPDETGAAEICAGALLTQNTSWTNVEKALGALSRERLLSAVKLALCPLPKLERAVRSSGYFRQKARRLKGFFGRALREHPEGLTGWFRRADTAGLRAELLTYPGVGPETADSIALYAAGKPAFVIDAYTRRFAERFGTGRSLSYDGWKALFESSLPPDVKVYNEYHALLVRLAKDFCKKTRPDCRNCPLAGTCEKRIYGPAKDRRTSRHR